MCTQVFLNTLERTWVRPWFRLHLLYCWCGDGWRTLSAVLLVTQLFISLSSVSWAFTAAVIIIQIIILAVSKAVFFRNFKLINVINVIRRFVLTSGGYLQWKVFHNADDKTYISQPPYWHPCYWVNLWLNSGCVYTVTFQPTRLPISISSGQ